MIGALLGLVGKMKTLTDRLTAARAGYLDNLNTNLSALPAPASTALSTAQWTNALATRLAGSGISQSATLTGSGTWAVPAAVSIVFVTMQAAGSSGAKRNGQPAGGGGAGELLLRIPSPVSPAGTVSYNAPTGPTGPTADNSGHNGAADATFGTLTAKAGGTSSCANGAAGGGVYGGAVVTASDADGAPGSAFSTFVIGGAAGGSGGAGAGAGWGGRCAPNHTGGLDAAGWYGGGGASFFSNGANATSATTPTKPGYGAGGGATGTGTAAGSGGDAVIIVEWIG